MLTQKVFVVVCIVLFGVSIAHGRSSDNGDDDDSYVGDIISGIISGIFSSIWEAIGESIHNMPDSPQKTIALTIFIAITILIIVLGFCALIERCQSDDPFNTHDAVCIGSALATHSLINSIRGRN
jgi:hypothetical protein